MNKTYTYRVQVKNRGLYAEIVYDTFFTQGDKSEIVIEYLAIKEWELPCKTGIILFFDYFTRQNFGKLTVTIHEIKWLPVDTNKLVVLFASIKALCEGLNFQVEKLEFDSSTETFNFPERRSI